MPTYEEYGLVVEAAGHVEVSAKVFTAFTVGISISLGI